MQPIAMKVETSVWRTGEQWGEYITQFMRFFGHAKNTALIAAVLGNVSKRGRVSTPSNGLPEILPLHWRQTRGEFLPQWSRLEPRAQHLRLEVQCRLQSPENIRTRHWTSGGWQWGCSAFCWRWWRMQRGTVPGHTRGMFQVIDWTHFAV